MGEILVGRGRIEGTTKHNGLRVKAYHDRSSRDPRREAKNAELEMCKRIVRVLKDEFPGHAWGVTVDGPNGYAQITIPSLLGVNWGMILHLDTIDKQKIINAGGEILERFKIPRSSINLAAYEDVLRKVPLIGNFRANHRQLIPT